ncbi:hypothetical protein Tco_1455826 [Tanacetum coccineum]
METMNVEFDELTQMAFEQHGSGPDLHGLTSGHIRSGLVLNQVTSTSAKPPTNNEWDLLFQPMFDEYFKNPSTAFNLISVATLFLPDTAEASSSSSTSTDKDVPSLSTSPNNEATNSLINSTNVEPIEEVSEFDSDTFTNLFAPPDTYSAKSSSRIVDTSNMHTFQQSPIYIKNGQKIITKAEPKNYKEAMEESCWIEAMKEEIYEFEQLEVWELVPRPEKAMIISLKWIFKVKLDEYGGVMKNKAQLVAKGLQTSQIPRGIFINQSKYAIEMLKKYGLDQCDAVDIPMVPGKAYRKALNYGKTGCQDSWKSTLGSAQFLGENLVSWSSKKQKCIAISSTEAEYISLSGCCDETHRYSLPLFKEQVENGVVKLYFVKTDYQLADIFT